ncbi:MAG TPA: sortase [Candidatus Limnocylindrales bacterium]|nr:sortase [Candidatus Limnocylindrales bacterium]
MPTVRGRRRTFLAFALAAQLLTASVPTPAMGAMRPASPRAGDGDANGSASGAPGAPSALWRPARGPAGSAARDARIAGRPRGTSGDDARRARADWIRREARDQPEAVARTMPAAAAAAPSSPAAYRGRNHVWIPALGIDRSVSGYACSSSAYPGDRVYRWGCAGSNNVYLFGHAHSVFRSLHDAYVRGRLSKGMRVIYADGRGHVATYAVSWWKVTTPDRGAWAYARQSRPSLTLQTCVGARSQYRLIVRLARVD